MKIIKSKDNPIYKAAARLTRKKYRGEEGLYMLEGIKPLEDALAMGIGIKNIFLCEGAESKCNFPENITITLGKKLFQSISETQNSQGVIAVAEKKKYSQESFAAEAAKGSGNVVVLDRLQDPGNIGTIIRTAEAAGYRGIVIVSGSGDVYAPKVVRAAAGSIFRMPIIYTKNGEQTVQMLRSLDKKIVTTCMNSDVYYDKVHLTKNIALVIGNEGQGVSEEIMNSSDIKIKIPMEGSIESLNAAVAAGILMYQSQKIN